MSRVGARRRWIRRDEAAVSCPSGRWGRRRTRTAECWARLSAEDCYTALLRDDAAAVRPGASGEFSGSLSGRKFSATFEIRDNAVWRQGRIFLRCSLCGGRCTRLYMPLPDSWLACRRCWGLTYSSRTLQNYKDSLFGRGAFARMLAVSQRDWALLATHEKRKLRRNRSRENWAKRRNYTRR